jgi:hypothetical protein
VAREAWTDITVGGLTVVSPDGTCSVMVARLEELPARPAAPDLTKPFWLLRWLRVEQPGSAKPPEIGRLRACDQAWTSRRLAHPSAQVQREPTAASRAVGPDVGPGRPGHVWATCQGGETTATVTHGRPALQLNRRGIQ